MPGNTRYARYLPPLTTWLGRGTPSRTYKRAYVMQSGDRFHWQLETPHPRKGEAVEAVLGLDRAKLSYGPYLFDFRKSSSERGELVLTLTPDGGPYPLRHPVLIGHDSHEQVIPRAPAYLSAGERQDLEARYLRVLGRALFDDVAHLVKTGMRLP